MESLTFKDVDPSKKKEVASVYFDQVGRVNETPVFLLGDVSSPSSFALRRLVADISLLLSVFST